MTSRVQYGVTFVGYSANVIARKYTRETNYASLDFVTGGALVHAETGFVAVPVLTELGPFLRSLPGRASQIRQLLQQAAEGKLTEHSELYSVTSSPTMINIRRGESVIAFAPGTHLARFIKEATKRFLEIDQVLTQAQQIGSQIKRRPYSEYIEEIEKTGISRVEGHGFGLFVHGRLIFHPKYEVALVKHVGERSFQIESTSASEKSG